MSDEEKEETVMYTAPKSSGAKVQYSAPCNECGTKLKSVEVHDHKAKCPECDYENPVRHA